MGKGAHHHTIPSLPFSLPHLPLLIHILIFPQLSFYLFPLPFSPNLPRFHFSDPLYSLPSTITTLCLSTENSL